MLHGAAEYSTRRRATLALQGNTTTAFPDTGEKMAANSCFNRNRPVTVY
jgi:hypothetical protein